MARHAAYNTARWKRRRADLLQREPLCRYCRARGIVTVATVADHITPHRGDMKAFWTADLQPLCAACHSAAKQNEEHIGLLRGGDTQGNPTDQRHHWNK